MSAERREASDMSFLVIGCGSIGKRHIANLRRLGVKNIVATDTSKSRRQEVHEQFSVPTVSDPTDSFSSNPDVALICSPTNMHLEHALMAAMAGCHLLVEKPIAHTLEGIEALLDEVERKALVTLVGCNFRFHPGLQRVKALLEQEAIGKVVSARAQFGQYLPDWHPWEDYRQTYSAQKSLGGGVMLDRIHEIDYLRWLLGEVTEVYAMQGHLSHLEIDTEDTVEILARFTQGAFGSIHLDYVRRISDSSLEVVGDAGLIQWSFNNNEVRWYLSKEHQWYTHQWPHYDVNDMYVAELEHFLKVLDGETASELDARAGVRVLSIALAAKQAAMEKKAIAL